ncbi:VQ motif-containing protein 8, chloroplastic [Corylus avellana]|uniref:VQ motif-containing protein 8, chloroplastic n=1 Tax=Corylus avellana TaxID=13451 RepID=UPI001E21CA5E|nr:VQ motif-containing protein 8, chloroplastic [Corylus avellana]
MSTAKFHVDDDGNSGRDIKGPRPSPLKINKASHFIHKSSSSSSTSMSSVLSDSAAPARQQQRRPVIIYTHSPKIIHTQARDFMALVQKLTGVSRPNDDEPTAQPDHHHHHQPHKSDIKSLSLEGGNDRNVKPVSHDDNDSSSALTDENCGGGGKGSSSSFLSPNLNLNQNQNQTNQYFADIPLFTPNSSSFYCSPRPVYRYPDSSYASPNVGNSMSPSVFEFLKGLPEY